MGSFFGHFGHFFNSVFELRIGTQNWTFGPFLGHFWDILDIFGTQYLNIWDIWDIFGHFGDVLDIFGTQNWTFGTFMGHFRAYWGLFWNSELELIIGHLGHLWDILGHFWGIFGTQYWTFGHFGPFLEPNGARTLGEF